MNIQPHLIGRKLRCKVGQTQIYQSTYDDTYWEACWGKRACVFAYQVDAAGNGRFDDDLIGCPDRDAVIAAVRMLETQHL